MWRLVYLCFITALASCWARPRLPPLSHEMVNYINKANTTWKVRIQHQTTGFVSTGIALDQPVRQTKYLETNRTVTGSNVHKISCFLSS